MIRLDKACDISTFTDSQSSRYALSAIRFRPPNRDEVGKHYRELRKPQEAYRTVKKLKKAGRPFDHREFAGMVIMNATMAYSQATAKVRGTVEATDGRRLISVPCLNCDEFPQTPGAGREPKECLIPADYFKQALQRIPRKAFKEVLKSARLTQHDDNNVILSTANGERSTDETVRMVEGRFPQTDDIWPKDAPEMTVRLDPALLEGIVKHAKTHGDDEHRGIDILVRGNDAAVEFRYQLSDNRTARALLMPLTTN